MTASEPVEEGDAELAAPSLEERADDLAPADEPPDDEVVRTTTRTRPNSMVLLLGAVLVAALANVVVGWFVLGATTQLRDQYTSANGLQRCLIRAQLNENSTTDPSGAAYKSAVQSCLNR